MLLVAAVTLIGATVAGCSSSGSPRGGQLTVKDATIDWPANPNLAAVRLSIHNDTPTDDVLIGATSPRAARVSIHRSVTDDGGRSTMKHVERLDVPAGEVVLFEAGGLHVMLEDPAPELEVGDKVNVTLEFKSAGKRTVSAAVIAPGSAGNTGDHHG